MGSGKTAVGRILADRLGWPFVDTDEIVEKNEGIKISEIFSSLGEPYFRDAEARAVAQAAGMDKTVISCGGGAVLRAANIDALEKTGRVVCLMASPETIYARTRHNDDRPLLRVEDPVKKIRELLESRREHYKRCAFLINTDDISAEEVADRILDKLGMK